MSFRRKQYEDEEEILERKPEIDIIARLSVIREIGMDKAVQSKYGQHFPVFISPINPLADVSDIPEVIGRRDAVLLTNFWLLTPPIMEPKDVATSLTWESEVKNFSDIQFSIGRRYRFEALGPEQKKGFLSFLFGR